MRPEFWEDAQQGPFSSVLERGARLLPGEKEDPSIAFPTLEDTVDFNTGRVDFDKFQNLPMDQAVKGFIYPKAAEAILGLPATFFDEWLRAGKVHRLPDVGDKANPKNLAEAKDLVETSIGNIGRTLMVMASGNFGGMQKGSYWMNFKDPPRPTTWQPGVEDIQKAIASGKTGVFKTNGFEIILQEGDTVETALNKEWTQYLDSVKDTATRATEAGTVKEVGGVVGAALTGGALGVIANPLSSGIRAALMTNSGRKIFELALKYPRATNIAANAIENAVQSVMDINYEPSKPRAALMSGVLGGAMGAIHKIDDPRILARHEADLIRSQQPGATIEEHLAATNKPEVKAAIFDRKLQELAPKTGAALDPRAITEFMSQSINSPEIAPLIDQRIMAASGGRYSMEGARNAKALHDTFAQHRIEGAGGTMESVAAQTRTIQTLRDFFNQFPEVMNDTAAVKAKLVEASPTYSHVFEQRLGEYPVQFQRAQAFREMMSDLATPSAAEAGVVRSNSLPSRFIEGVANITRNSGSIDHSLTTGIWSAARAAANLEKIGVEIEGHLGAAAEFPGDVAPLRNLTAAFTAAADSKSFIDPLLVKRELQAMRQAGHNTDVVGAQINIWNNEVAATHEALAQVTDELTASHIADTRNVVVKEADATHAPHERMMASILDQENFTAESVQTGIIRQFDSLARADVPYSPEARVAAKDLLFEVSERMHRLERVTDEARAQIDAFVQEAPPGEKSRWVAGAPGRRR